MKKLRIILLIFLFALCSLSGFALAAQIQQWITPIETDNAETPDAFSLQQNLLIIHTTDLKGSQVKLVSLWVVFIAIANPPNLVFKSIYPNTEIPGSRQLFETFALTSTGSLPIGFLDSLNKLEIHQNGFFLIDNQGFSALTTWITGKPSEINSADPDNPGQQYLTLSYEQMIFENICLAISQPVNPKPDNPPWSTLIPKHIRTNLDFEQAAILWDILSNSVTPPVCKVLIQ